MIPERSDTATLDPRVGELVSATALVTRVGEITDLLVEARDRLLAAERLAERLPRSELLELDERVDRTRLEEFTAAMTSIDSSSITVELESIQGLREALVDVASDLRQGLYDSLATVRDDG